MSSGFLFLPTKAIGMESDWAGVWVGVRLYGKRDEGRCHDTQAQCGLGEEPERLSKVISH